MNLFELVINPLLGKNKCLICKKGTTFFTVICKDCDQNIRDNSRPRISYLATCQTTTANCDFIPVLSISRHRENPFLSLAIKNFKFKNAKQLGEYLAQLYYETIYSLLPNLIANDKVKILYVPIHYFKYCTRGFDHTKLMAEKLSTISKLKIWQAVKKVKYTKEQILLKKNQRSNNLVNSFELRSIKSKPPDYLIILDDVITTGSTIREILNILKPIWPDVNSKALAICLIGKS